MSLPTTAYTIIWNYSYDCNLTVCLINLHSNSSQVVSFALMWMMWSSQKCIPLCYNWNNGSIRAMSSQACLSLSYSWTVRCNSISPAWIQFNNLTVNFEISIFVLFYYFSSGKSNAPVRLVIRTKGSDCFY